MFIAFINICGKRQLQNHNQQIHNGKQYYHVLLSFLFLPKLDKNLMAYKGLEKHTDVC